MIPLERAWAPLQRGSLAILDIAPRVPFVAVEVTTARVTLRHPSGAPITVPSWRVRRMAG